MPYGAMSSGLYGFPERARNVAVGQAAVVLVNTATSNYILLGLILQPNFQPCGETRGLDPECEAVF